MTYLDAFLEFRRLLPKMVHSLIKNSDLQTGINEDLNKTQIFTILYVWIHKECKMTFLCKHLNVTKSTMTSVIDSLEKRDIVVRNRKKNDRRSIFISLTEKGEFLGEKIKIDINQNFNEKMELLTEEDRKLFWQSLENINLVMEKIEKLNE